MPVQPHFPEIGGTGVPPVRNIPAVTRRRDACATKNAVAARAMHRSRTLLIVAGMIAMMPIGSLAQTAPKPTEPAPSQEPAETPAKKPAPKKTLPPAPKKQPRDAAAEEAKDKADNERRKMLAEVTRELDKAWRAGDQAAVEDGLNRGWTIDERWGKDNALKVVQTGAPGFRPVGAAVLARRGDAPTLVIAADHLDERKYPDERRLFVRRLSKSGEEQQPEIVKDLKRFLADKDPGVKLAAIGALADLGDAAALRLLAERAGEVPAQRESFNANDQGLIDMHLYGALRSIADLRPLRSSDVAAWYDKGAPIPKRQKFDPEEMRIVEGKRGGRKYYETPTFDLYYRIGAEDDAPSGALGVRPFTRASEGAVRAALAASQAIFGVPHLPIIRLYIADERQFQAIGGQANFGGVAKGNEIVLRLGRNETMSMTLAHEYVHIIHSAHYQDQPRWMSEGLAESLTLSPDESVWNGARVARLNLRKEVEAGVFSEITQWDTGGSGDAKEGIRYSLAHIAIDTLRHTGFAAPEERLAFLMGRLERKENAARALEQLYGMNLRELDDRVRGWLSGP
jgi:hypothetical protein